MMKKIIITFVVTCLISIAPASNNVWAATKAGQSAVRVRAIEVVGNQRVEKETIESYLTVSKGDALTQNQIDASLKKLFETGLFADVVIERKGDALHIKVKENPLINEVSFEGNKRIKNEDLAQEITLKPRSVYTKLRLQQDVGRILDIYHKSGRFSVTVTPKLIELPQNRINVVFEIDEGPKTSVRKVLFVGNKKVSDRKLKSLLHTKEARWYRFFSGNDTYDSDRVEFDKEVLRKYYLSIGYADFKVVSAVAELTPRKDAFILTYTVEEGERYDFGQVNLVSQLEKVKTEQLKGNIKTREGDIFNAEQVEASIEAMVKDLSDQGYAFVDVDPQFARDPLQRKIGVTYMIKEGRKVYIDRINIKGNVRTMDDVIRREFRVSEGDPYNAAQIRRSEQRIKNLGFFDKVDVTNVRTDSEDKVDIDVEVTEKSTGEVNFGAGFSTADGALANAGIRERNLLGRGQDLRLDFQRAQKKMDLDLGFTEPYFLDRDISAGFDLFAVNQYRKSESSYNSETKGGVVRLSYALTEYLQHTVKYSLDDTNITDVTIDASRLIRDQEGRNTTSLVGHSLFYDKRDSKFSPTTGYSVRLNQDVAGLGGDSEFFRQELRTSYFTPITKNKKLILQLFANGGHIMGLNGQDVRINQRFFVGGDDLRGFKTAGIGPRDTGTTDALGGNTYYTGSAQLSFPLGLPDELDISGLFFTDVGSLFSVDAKGSEIADNKSPRVSLGTGIALGSPLGPIRIDLGYPLVKEKFDRTQILRFSFGTRF